MKRRDIIKSALAGAGAVTTGATTAQAATAQAPATPAAAVKPAWKPLLFDAHQNETVTTLAELIIPRTDTPGARDAKVNEYIDLILNDGPVERRNRFISGLNWLDGLALRQHAAPFQRLNAAQQIAMLKSLDGSRDEALRPGAEFFRQIKQLTVQGYYTSRAGIDELNKGSRVPSSFGCEHKGSH